MITIQNFSKSNVGGFSFGVSKESMVSALRLLADDFEAGRLILTTEPKSAVTIAHRATADDFAVVEIRIEAVERTA